MNMISVRSSSSLSEPPVTLTSKQMGVLLSSSKKSLTQQELAYACCGYNRQEDCIHIAANAD